MTSNKLQIGGLTTFSSVDYPDKISAVVHCQGCTSRCAYCHNPGLLPKTAKDGGISWDAVTSALDDRKDFIDAVVFSGGEPTRQGALQEAIVQTKQMGFLLGLHTAGFFPQRLRAALPFLDWVGLDIKADIEDYERVTGIAVYGAKAWSSALMLIASGVSYEIRTTVHPNIVSPADMEAIAKHLLYIGAQHIVIQLYRPGAGIDGLLPSITRQEIERYQAICGLSPKISIR